MNNSLSVHDGSILDDKALASRGTPEGTTIKLGRQPRATPPGPLVVRWDPEQCEGQQWSFPSLGPTCAAQVQGALTLWTLQSVAQPRAQRQCTPWIPIGAMVPAPPPPVSRQILCGA
eukprot:scaffold14576_cov132-Isochrysis_galbana.AAC.13